MLTSVAAVARDLRIDARVAEKVARAGILGELFTAERTGLLVNPAAAAEVVGREPVGPPHPPAFVVRLDAAALEDDPDRAGRRWRGWHESLKDAPDSVSAWDRWWPVRDRAAIVDLPVVAVVGPVVVAVRHIDAVLPEFGRHRLATSEPTADELAAFGQRLLWTPPGGVTIHLRANSAEDARKLRR